MAGSDIACGCRILAAVACGVALCGGSLLLFASQHRRAHAISGYAPFVHAWDSEVRPDFDGAALFVNASSEPHGGQTLRGARLRLAPNATDSPLRDRGADVPRHAPLRYETGAPLLAQNARWTEAGVWLSLSSGNPRQRCPAFLLGGIDGIALGYRRERMWHQPRTACARQGGSFVPPRSTCVRAPRAVAPTARASSAPRPCRA